MLKAMLILEYLLKVIINLNSRPSKYLNKVLSFK